MKQKDYYNLVRNFDKRTPESELEKAVQACERRGFHVRFCERYVVEQDERRRRVVEHAFFCNSECVILARRFNSSSRYRRKGSDLIEASTLDAIVFQKSLSNSQRAEEFAKEYAELTKRFTAKWKAKETSRQTIPTTFPDEMKPKGHLVYKKSGKRGRVFTGPQLAEHNEQQIKRKKKEAEIDTERIRCHISLEKEDRCREVEEA